MSVLKKLYNGIKNDYSIQRYSLGWSVICEKIEKKYKQPIEKTQEQFSNNLLKSAINASNNKLKNDLISFAKELSINIDTLNEKSF